MADISLVTGFFAYPCEPAISEAIQEALHQVNRSKQVFIKTWEQCRTGGKVIVDELCSQIDLASLFCADLTGMNANVMFELGYAIGKDKRVWLILDTSRIDSKKQFDQLRVLTTIGYANYCNSADIKDALFREQPYSDLGTTIFRQVIQPQLAPASRHAILHLKSRHDNEASIKIGRTLDKSGIPCVEDDPRESSLQSLSWYGGQVYSSFGVICHLTSPEREGAWLHNARHALVAGMALAMSKPLLMLAEGNFLAPMDYRDILRHYETGTQGNRWLQEWLEPLKANWQKTKLSQREYAANLELVAELKSLRFGEPIAENEAEQLVHDYFVETSFYREALNGKQTIFVGRKGTGKTANLLMLASQLERDRRNLLCVIKPAAYELEGIIALMDSYTQRDVKGYAIESLWKFLLYTEVANSIATEIQARPFEPPNADEGRLLDILGQNAGVLREEFAVRLEHCVTELLRRGSPHTGVGPARAAISEALHEGMLRELRLILGKVLATKQRVAILVDNLDKAWTKQGRVSVLAEFFLGLLRVSGRMRQDFQHHDSRRQAANVTLAVFLRSDIFYEVMNVAREPDKIPYSRITWNDRELLLRVVEERYITSHEGQTTASELWQRYFCATVHGIPTRDYFVSQTLARPRDLLFFVNASVATAINRGHTVVADADIVEAERQYSQYALESILVETGVSASPLEAIIYEFAGARAYLTYDEVASCISHAGVPEQEIEKVIGYLCALTFLGIEVDRSDFRFADDPNEYRKNLALARRLSQSLQMPLRYMINRPFWAFLEVVA